MKRLLRSIKYRLWGIPRRPAQLDRSLLLLGTFKQLGWYSSVQKGAPVDWQGNPLPWYTYPAIFWLEGILTRKERVFEFGAGSSTLWYSQRVSQIVSVEHDLNWYRHLRKNLPANIELMHAPTNADESSEEVNDPYVQSILATGDSMFDIVVVDGQARNACCKTAVQRLRPGGLLVFDNSERITYEPAHRFLASEGYSRLDFSGPLPAQSNWSCTSVFFKSLNEWPTTERRPPYWRTMIIDFQPGFPISARDPR